MSDTNPHRHRTNFHEDDLRHYLIKADNARQDGKRVGVENYTPAKRSSLIELLEHGNLSPRVRKRLEEVTGHKTPMQKLLDSVSPEKAAQIQAFLNS